MDNLAHTLCGAALARTRLGSLSRFAPAALILGANLPDVDIVAQLIGGKEAYLVHHRGITHSFFGIAVQTVLLAALVRWFERRFAPAEPGVASVDEGATADATRAAVSPPQSSSWGAFLLPAFVGLLSHLALDWLNNYGVRPWLPFSHARFFGDLVSIVDPAMWALFGAIALLGGRRSKAGHCTWAALAAFTLWLVYTSPRSPESVKTYWPVVVAALALLRALGVGRERPRRVVLGGALLFATYLVGLEVSAHLAWRNALAMRDPGRSIAAGIQEPWHRAMRSPVLCDPFRWIFVLETEHAYFPRDVRVDGTSEKPWPAIEHDLDDPAIRAAEETPRGRAWRYFARLPVAEVTPRPDGSSTVLLLDARYRNADWCALAVEVPPPAGTR
jgi:inner membrane protein